MTGLCPARWPRAGSFVRNRRDGAFVRESQCLARHLSVIVLGVIAAVEAPTSANILSQAPLSSPHPYLAYKRLGARSGHLIGGRPQRGLRLCDPTLNPCFIYLKSLL